MRFGHFDDQNKEYVITTPQTPLPWINYLGSEDFFSLVSNTAGGYSFYRDARLLMGGEIQIYAVPLAKFAVSFDEAKGDFIGREPLRKCLVYLIVNFSVV